MVLVSGVLGAKAGGLFEKAVFFSRSRLTLQQWVFILYLWARQYPVTDVAEEIGVEEHTAIDIYQWLREVCSSKLLQSPIVLGGPGVVDHMDESLFRHKPKVTIHGITVMRYHSMLSIVPWREGHQKRDLGVWHRRHQPATSTWLHAGGSKTGCTNIATDYSSPCGTRLHCS